MGFKFLNLNPLGKREEDCVCRAISLATKEDYEDIQEQLYLVGKLFRCEKLCVCCYKHLLDYVYNFDRIESFQGYTIDEFKIMNPHGTYIVRVNGHLTCVIDGEIWDTWDCGHYIVDIVWEVPSYKH